MTEKRTLKMHPKLLHDVIKRQAGTLAKAILEGIMNSIDACATECRVTINSKLTTITDDGNGFTSKREIESWFEVFGAPHSDSENKVYGTFRMGRGQMFAFGRNTWRTGKFTMVVDFANHGTDYELHQVKKAHPGCQIGIELYEALSPSWLHETINSLQLWCKYAPIPVYINDELISVDPATEKWTKETDEAYIRVKPHGQLSVYNLGIHVLAYGGYHFGIGGDVVSKKQLRVNFARNDIQSDCKVWKKLRPLLDELGGQSITAKKVMNDDERQRMADKFLSGDLGWEGLSKLKLITAVNGRQYSPDALYRTYMWPKVTNAPRGDRRGDKLMQGKQAFVIADETLDRFRVKSVRALIDKFVLITRRCNGMWERIVIVSYEEATAGITDNHDLLTKKELKPVEKLWLAVIQNGIQFMRSIDPLAHRRTVQLGVSETAAAWTDGRSFIVVGRDFLDKLQFDIYGFGRLGNLLLHEMTHQSEDIKSHAHDQDFYENFHDHADAIGAFVKQAVSYLPNACKTVNRKLTQQQLYMLDTVNSATKVRKPVVELL